MASKVFSAAINGLNAQIVEIEVDTNFGLRCFNIVGLPDKAIEESKERVSAAIKSLGFQSPQQQPIRVLVNLAPADLKKEGSLYDLPIALGYLLATKQAKFSADGKLFIGELSLDGKLRPVKGALSFAIAARENHWKELILPANNAAEAGLIKDLDIIGIHSLKQAVDYLEKRNKPTAYKTVIHKDISAENYPVDLSWIKGQNHAKRGLEIAAAGGHNLLMSGPPGTGKTLLAKAISSILPCLSFEEAIEVTKIYSVAGLLPKNQTLMQNRPFRSPHHSSSESALIGGGNPPRPGEITLAHRGVLFLDEFPEFHKDVLESLRQPLEEGRITILRAKHTLSLPARFILIAAANPCPCGNYGNPEKICSCSNSQIQKYKRKLSGPLIDRIDMVLQVPFIKYEKLTDEKKEVSSKEIREEVEKARQIQKQRFEQDDFFINSEMRVPDIKKYCEIDKKSQNFLKHYVNSGKLSARGYHRILKIARTIADLANSENITFDHITEAVMYRKKES